MKYITIICLFTLVSCATERGPASVSGDNVAKDSMALGNVKATAVKRADKQNVCFDIKLVLKNVKQEQAKSSNWTLAWVDKNNQYHLLPMTQRDPASTPKGGTIVDQYGAHQEWRNNFTTCARSTNMNEVKKLVLTPKELPYNKKDGLQLNWN